MGKVRPKCVLVRRIEFTHICILRLDWLPVKARCVLAFFSDRQPGATVCGTYVDKAEAIAAYERTRDTLIKEFIKTAFATLGALPK